MRPLASLSGAAALAAFLGGLGCTNRVFFDPVPAAGARVVSGGSQRVAIGSPLAIEWIEARRAGFEVNPSSELIAFCIDGFRTAGSFSEVVGPRAAHAAPPGGYRLGIRIDERYDPRPVATGSKLVLTMATGVLPGTLVPYYFDDHVVAEGELETPRGTTRRYRAERSGTVRSFLMADLTRAESELRARVASVAVSALIGAITTDSELAAPPRELP